MNTIPHPMSTADVLVSVLILTVIFFYLTMVCIVVTVDAYYFVSRRYRLQKVKIP